MAHEDNLAPDAWGVMSSFLVLAFAAFFGKCRDLLCFLLRVVTGRQIARPGYAPVRDPSEDFYMRRMYGRIVDCWNRPICSAPGAWVDVMDRTKTTESTDQDISQITPTGGAVHCLNLASYNYLGFAASDPYCTPRVVDTIQALGVSTCSPRVLAGTTAAHTQLETLVAEYLGVEAALTYGMGFATNSSTIPALVGKGCLVMSDALNHSSIVAGARQSGAKVKVFRHNDARHLDALLRMSIAEGQPRSHRPWKKVLVIVEGVYSMEGETCCLKEIVETAKKYKAYVYLDEAHSIGALGPTGRGCCEHWGVDPRDVDVMMGTFTKSFGSCGGYVAGKRELIEHLRHHSPAHLYACAMAPGAVEQVISALNVIMGRDGTDRGARKIKQLHDNANYVRGRLLQMGMDVLGSWDSPVMPIMTYNPAKMTALSRLCLQRHLAMVIVGFPATPLLLTRTRICISAAHTRKDLEWALDMLEEVADLVKIRYGHKALFKRMERELKEHMARLHGPEAAAAASVAALAAGAFDPLRPQRLTSGTQEDGAAVAGKKVGDKREQNGASMIAKRPRQAQVSVAVNGTAGAHAKAFIRTEAMVHK